jgi:hypothetical protein
MNQSCRILSKSEGKNNFNLQDLAFHGCCRLYWGWGYARKTWTRSQLHMSGLEFISFPGRQWVQKNTSFARFGRRKYYLPNTSLAWHELSIVQKCNAPSGLISLPSWPVLAEHMFFATEQTRSWPVFQPLQWPCHASIRSENKFQQICIRAVTYRETDYNFHMNRAGLNYKLQELNRTIRYLF